MLKCKVWLQYEQLKLCTLQRKVPLLQQHGTIM